MTAVTHPRHQVSRAVAQLETTLDEVADASLWSMPTEETAEALVRLTRVAARLTELEARLATHAGTVGVAEQVGATSVANWWAHETRMTRTEAHRKTHLAAALEHHGPVHDALRTGDLLVDQARVIIRAVEDLPDHVDPEMVVQAERHLIGEAAHFDANALRNLGHGLLHVIDPEAADAHEARLLEHEERAAAQTTRLTLREDNGVLRGTFTLPAAQGHLLKKQLMAFAAPKHRAATHGPGGGTAGERLPGPERLGRAFCEWIERYPADRVPNAGGVSATVVVTIPIDTLLDGLAPGVLDTGTAISPPGLRGRDHPHRPRRRRRGPRRRPAPPVPHQSHAAGDRAPRQDLHHRRLRLATRPVPHPPQPTLGSRWQHQRQRRATPLPTTPRPSPRPDLHDDRAPRRQGRLHPADLDRGTIGLFYDACRDLIGT